MGLRGWQSRNLSQVKLSTTSWSDQLDFVSGLCSRWLPLIRHHYKQVHWATTKIYEAGGWELCLLALLLPAPGDLGLPVIPVFPMKWDRSKFSGKNLRMLGKLDVCFWFSFPTVEPMSPGASSLCSPVPALGREWDTVVSKTISLTLSCSVYLFLWSMQVSQVYSQVLRFSQRCSRLLVTAFSE